MVRFNTQQTRTKKLRTRRRQFPQPQDSKILTQQRPPTPRRSYTREELRIAGIDLARSERFLAREQQGTAAQREKVARREKEGKETGGARERLARDILRLQRREEDVVSRREALGENLSEARQYAPRDYTSGRFQGATSQEQKSIRSTVSEAQKTGGIYTLPDGGTIVTQTPLGFRRNTRGEQTRIQEGAAGKNFPQKSVRGSVSGVTTLLTKKTPQKNKRVTAESLGVTSGMIRTLTTPPKQTLQQPGGIPRSGLKNKPVVTAFVRPSQPLATSIGLSGGGLVYNTGGGFLVRPQETGNTLDRAEQRRQDKLRLRIELQKQAKTKTPSVFASADKLTRRVVFPITTQAAEQGFFPSPGQAGNALTSFLTLGFVNPPFNPKSTTQEARVFDAALRPYITQTGISLREQGISLQNQRSIEGGVRSPSAFEKRIGSGIEKLGERLQFKPSETFRSAQSTLLVSAGLGLGTRALANVLVKGGGRIATGVVASEKALKVVAPTGIAAFALAFPDKFIAGSPELVSGVTGFSLGFGSSIRDVKVSDVSNIKFGESVLSKGRPFRVSGSGQQRVSFNLYGEPSGATLRVPVTVEGTPSGGGFNIRMFSEPVKFQAGGSAVRVRGKSASGTLEFVDRPGLESVSLLRIKKNLFGGDTVLVGASQEGVLLSENPLGVREFSSTSGSLLLRDNVVVQSRGGFTRTTTGGTNIPFRALEVSPELLRSPETVVGTSVRSQSFVMRGFPETLDQAGLFGRAVEFGRAGESVLARPGKRLLNRRGQFGESSAVSRGDSAVFDPTDSFGLGGSKAVSRGASGFRSNAFPKIFPSVRNIVLSPSLFGGLPLLRSGFLSRARTEEAVGSQGLPGVREGFLSQEAPVSRGNVNVGFDAGSVGLPIPSTSALVSSRVSSRASPFVPVFASGVFRPSLSTPAGGFFLPALGGGGRGRGGAGKVSRGFRPSRTLAEVFFGGGGRVAKKVRGGFTGLELSRTRRVSKKKRKRKRKSVRKRKKRTTTSKKKRKR